MTAPDALIRSFVLDFFREIEATAVEHEGIYTVTFPPGRKRRFGRERQITFDAAHRKEHVELMEPGSPLLKMLVQEAQGFGVAGAAAVPGCAPGTRLYVFQMDTYSSTRKRTGFAWARLDPDVERPTVGEGLPPGWESPFPGAPVMAGDFDELRAGLGRVGDSIEQAGRIFAKDTVAEAAATFRAALSRVDQYFEGMHQDTFLEEARIRKRLGEIQSKLYFTEDGLRELKLQKESERLQAELHVLKKQNTERSQGLREDKTKHEDKQRRRHEPKLRIRLLTAVYVRGSVPGTPVAPVAQ